MLKPFSSKNFDKAIEMLFFIIVALVPIVFDRRIGIVFSLTKATFLYSLVALILGLWAIKLIICKEHRFVKLPSNWPVLSYLLACTVATLTSVHVLTSLVGFYGRYEGLITLYTYGLLFFIASNYIFNLHLLKRMIALISCSGMIMAVYSIIQRHALDPYMWGGVATKDRVIATIGQPNFWAAYCVMAFLLVLAFLFHEKNDNLPTRPANELPNSTSKKSQNKKPPMVSKSKINLAWLDQLSIVAYYLIAQITFLIMIYNIDTNNPILWYVGFFIITVASLFFAYNFEKLHGTLLNLVLFINVFLLYVSLLYTQSRGGYMGFFVGMILFFLIAGKEVLFRNWKKIVALLALIVSVTFVVFVFVKASPLERFTSEVKFEQTGSVTKTTETKPADKLEVGVSLNDKLAEVGGEQKREKKMLFSGAAGSRIETWKSALRIISERPFFGIGPEVLKMVFPRYETWLFRFREAFHVKQDRCHNSICDQSVTRGLVSFLLIVVLVFVVFKGVIKAAGQASTEKKLFLGAILAAIASYIVQNQFSFGVVAIGSLFWVLMGVASRFAFFDDECDQVERRFGWEEVPWFSVTLIGILVLAVFYLASIPFRADMYFKSGKTFAEMGRLPQAIENYEKSLSIFPYEGGANTHYGIAYLNYSQANMSTPGTFDKVKNIFIRTLYIDPYNADNLFILGKLYIINAGRLGKVAVDQAVAYSNQALAVDPYYAEVYLTLGYASDLSGQKQAAAKYFVKAFEINPHLDEAMQRANYIFKSYPGGMEEGVAAYQAVLKKYHQNEIPRERALILRYLADLYLAQGQGAAAEKLFDDILQVAPNDINVQASLASLYVDMGKLEAAFNILKTAMVIDPKNIAVHSALARYYVKIGNRELARQEFGQILQLDPNSGFAKDALKRLQ